MITLLNTHHPRLFINQEKINTLKAYMDDDAFFRTLAHQLLHRADELIPEKNVEFKITGPRMLKNCQEIHARVSTLALAYHLSEEKKYAERAAEELRSAAQFPHWNKDHFLDTGELITAFAIGYDWLFHVLSEQDKNLFRSAMIDKGIKIGINLHENNIWWAAHKYNWNQVCNGGLIIGAIAIADKEPQLTNKVFDTVTKHLPIAFNSYGKDGGWEGGPDYWDYTTWFSILLIDALFTNTGDDFGLAGTKGFDKTALFPIYNRGTSSKQFNFADANPEDTHKSYPTLFWLGDYFNIDAAINENIRLLQTSIDNNLPFHAFNLVWYKSRIKNANPLPLNRKFSGINAGYIRKAWNNKALSLALKGGYNLADHAHLDLGSFVLDFDGQRWASDLGRDDYDLPDYFDKTVGGGRWKYFRLNTQSHNTLILNDENQVEDAKADIVQFESQHKLSSAAIDMTQAYATHARSVIRTFEINNENSLTITDTIEAKPSLKTTRWQILTDANIAVSGNIATLTKKGEQVLVVTLLQPLNAEFVVSTAIAPHPQQHNGNFKILSAEINANQQDINGFIVSFDFQPKEKK